MRRIELPIALAAVLAVAAGCGPGARQEPPKPAPAPPAPVEEVVTIDPATLGAFGVLPAVMESAENPVTPEKTALGRMLYFDERLSKSQKISCNTCHDLARYGVDGKPVSDGHLGQRGTRNSPTVYNAAGHFAQFWDGREPTVEAQAKGPVMNPVEMAMPDEKRLIRVLGSMPAYVEAFKKAFPEATEPVTIDTMAMAIGAFERQLVTRDRWDKLQGGDAAALTNAEKKGFQAFIAGGCLTCHMGPYLGGNMYQKLGLIKPWPSEADLGRYAVTKNDADKMMFKVPSLRNVTETGPWFHDGKTASLEEAVRLMAEHQVGQVLTPEAAQSIVKFLGALKGDLPPQSLIGKPALPPGTANTPGPDLT